MHCKPTALAQFEWPCTVHICPAGHFQVPHILQPPSVSISCSCWGKEFKLDHPFAWPWNYTSTGTLHTVLQSIAGRTVACFLLDLTFQDTSLEPFQCCKVSLFHCQCLSVCPALASTCVTGGPPPSTASLFIFCLCVNNLLCRRRAPGD